MALLRLKSPRRRLKLLRAKSSREPLSRLVDSLWEKPLVEWEPLI